MYLLWLEVIKPINFNNTYELLQGEKEFDIQILGFSFYKKKTKQKNTMSTDN